MTPAQGGFGVLAGGGRTRHRQQGVGLSCGVARYCPPGFVNLEGARSLQVGRGGRVLPWAVWAQLQRGGLDGWGRGWEQAETLTSDP